MSSLGQLASIQPRENAGASSSNRFEYQINWGLHRLLQLEDEEDMKNDKDDDGYVMILDYHDDIVVCNSDSGKDYIDFYQIKTRKNSNWGIRNLCYKKIGEVDGNDDSDIPDEQEVHNEQTEDSQDNIASKISIVAKLLQHTMDFANTRNLYFVTNAHIRFIGNKPFCKFSGLTKNDKDKIKEKIKQQVENIKEENFEKLIFVQNEMSETRYKDTMLGELMNYLKRKFEISTDTDVVYKNLISLIRNKTNYENFVDNKQDLIKYKAITHKEFREYLIGLTTIKDFNEIVQRIKSDLKDNMSEDSIKELTFPIKSKIRSELSKIKCDILNYGDDELNRLISKINIALKDDIEESDVDLWYYVKRIYKNVMSEYNNYKNYEEYYVKSLILYLYEKS
jgi:hypothetical protein